MYNSILPSDFSQSDSDLRKQPGKNSFASHRSPPFNSFNGHSLLPQSSIPSGNYVTTYSPDIFPQHMQSNDSQTHLSLGRFDMGAIQSSQSLSEDAYVGMDQYGNNEIGSMILQHASNPQPQQPPYAQAPYMNGLTHVQSQTPYGPHLAGTLNQTAATAISPSSSMHHPNGTAQVGSQQEEISTIFVVGFPDDMQEREFQNMFTFSSGFEAATLKIPNKELTSYGSNGNVAPNRPPLYPQSYNASNDPYSLVTTNQGGVVVDNGRDGTTAWPVPADESSYLPSAAPQPPRKQIIGFAKFRTRQEALDAKDILQGRRVDIEKGAVLKAEMAKKNLHTKRGPVAAGPPGLSSITAASAGAADSASGFNNIQNSEPMSARERELGTLGAMGFGSRRDRIPDPREDEDRERRISDGVNSNTRGARERAEEDERERERRRQEKDAANLRSAAAFDAFHSVPPQIPRLLPQNSLTSASGSSGIISSQSSTQDSFSSGVWGMTAKETGSRKVVVPIHVPDVSPGPASPQIGQSSPPKSAPFSQSSHSVGSEGSSSHHNSVTFSPPSNAFSLPTHPSLPTRPGPFSPTSFDQAQPHSLPSSSASSVDGSGSMEGEFAKNVAGLTTGSEGSTSPQLPSPASAGAAGVGARGNPGDQNPPINTLYVGNLPSSPPPPGYNPSCLEDELRELFGRRPGYRKLCFRQKNNGPMCFVEFEDVRHATKALHELHGHTLGGLVKGGGIRLSYSKNPLGVRTPTSATGAGLQQQQYKEFHNHSAPPSSSVFPPESFSRQFSSSDDRTCTLPRRDTLPQQPSYQYTSSPPAPRFVAASSPTTHYTTSVGQLPNPHVSSFPRSIQSQYGLDTVASSTFSPFRMSSTSPHLDQFGAVVLSSNVHPANERFGHTLSPPPVNGIEASRAG